MFKLTAHVKDTLVSHMEWQLPLNCFIYLIFGIPGYKFAKVMISRYSMIITSEI